MLTYFSANRSIFRAMIIVFAIIFLSFLAAYLHIKEPDLKQSEMIKILNGSMIIIGLIYTIMTYEFNHSKTLFEIRVRKTTATYDMIREWHSSTMSEHQKRCYEFASENKNIFLNNDIQNFIVSFNSNINIEYKKSLSEVLNYFESIAVSVCEELTDEMLMKKHFRKLLFNFYDVYFPFIEDIRKTQMNDDIWKEFTNLVERWRIS